jgi:serine/threonine protein kinase
MPDPEVKATHPLQGAAADSAQSESSASSQTVRLEAGEILGGRYRIAKELGRGGIGVVFLAHDQKLHDTPVVIKVLLEAVRDSEHRDWFEKHFRQEAEAMARIDHPGVVRVLDTGELSDGRAWIVMQFVAGADLRSLMKPQGMELPRVAHLIRQMGQALTAAHEQGVIHRDLKPENIMIQQAGDEEYVKIIDFGIATVHEKRAADPTFVRTTYIAGTFAYMAPEQFEGRPGASSDVYALGVIAYEMVTGRHPFNFETPYQLRELQQAGVRVNPGDLRPALPAAAQAAILRALAYAREERYPRARDFGEALAQALITEKAEGQSSRLELAHVLFTDLVGYSTLPINEQERLLQQLQKIVSSTEEFIRAQSARQLLRLPTGDGMALVFFGDPVAPAQCAVEIARALRGQPDIRLRMGIHTGPVRRMADINQNLNVSGGGINIAQRVMDCGDAGHILLSKTVADVLGQLSEWKPALHDLGEQVVKHGERVHLFSLYTEEAGNPALPAKLQTKKPQPRTVPWTKILLAGALLLVIAGGSWLVWPLITSAPGQRTTTTETPVTTATTRELIYWLTAQRNPRLFPGSKPFILPGEAVMGAGDRVRLHINSPQAGYLYVINEGPKLRNNLPEYNVLFPYSTMNRGSAEIRAGQNIQIPQPSGNPEQDWFSLDTDEGAEKIWLVWSLRSVPEMEAVKRQANPRDQGEIRDPAQINSVRQFLESQSATASRTEKDETKQQTRLTGTGAVLVKMLRMEHR